MCLHCGAGSAPIFMLRWGHDCHCPCPPSWSCFSLKGPLTVHSAQNADSVCIYFTNTMLSQYCLCTWMHLWTYPPLLCVWIASDTRCWTVSGSYTVPLLSFLYTHSCSFSAQSMVSQLFKIQKNPSPHFGQWGCRNVRGLTSNLWKNSQTNILDIKVTPQLQDKCLVPSSMACVAVLCHHHTCFAGTDVQDSS